MLGNKTRIAMIMYREGYVSFDYVLLVLEGELKVEKELTTFYCVECCERFEVADDEIVQAMVNEHLETGDGFTCPKCSHNEDIP